MSFNKSKLAACLGVAMGVSALTANVSAIEVAANDSGRLLIAPIFLAHANEITRITVTNPDNDRAVKARLAFRSRGWSDEFLDFIIYLSPGDVFRGELYANADGVVRFRSADDSVRHLPGNKNEVVFSSQSPSDFAVPLDGLDHSSAGDTATSGHIEVLSVYAAGSKSSNVADKQVVVDRAGTTVGVFRGMSKLELAKIFDKPLDVLLPLNGCTTADESCAVLKQTVAGTANITGQIELVMGVDKAIPNRSFHNMTALADSDENNNGTIECGLPIEPAYCESVIGNGSFDVLVGNELEIGKQLGAGGLDNIINIERALSARWSNGIYENNNDTSTMILTTFPTKYRHDGEDVCANPGFTTPVPTWSSPFRVDGGATYFVNQFNNREFIAGFCEPSVSVDSDLISGNNDTTISIDCPPVHFYSEVEVLAYDWTKQMDGTPNPFESFASGKYLMEFTPSLINTTCSNLVWGYDGYPVIVKTIKQVKSNGQIIGILDNSNLAE
jgi:hypothetical protein